MSIEVKVSKFVPVTKANEFAEVVGDIADAGADALGTVTIPEGIALSTAQAKIRAAARDAGLKARIRSVDADSREVSFTIHARKAADSSANEATDAAKAV